MIRPITGCVKAKLNNMNISLIDHIIVSRTEARSTFHGSVVILENSLRVIHFANFLHFSALFY